MVRVVIADDQALLRGSFRALIDSDPDFTVVGEAGTGRQAVDIVDQQQPDLVLMDVRMPEMDGIEATRLICAARPETRVLILTMFDLDAYVYGALRAGASGFLLKDARPGDLLAAVRTVAAGDALIAPKVTRRLITEFTRRPVQRRAAEELTMITERETDVLTLIAKGHSNAEIAQRLYVSQGTVKTHVSHLLGKFKARDRAQLVIVAYETGLVSVASDLLGD
ncbi:response regulator transcription factor [Kibdelosporangium philippinense]|uniref:Response regulator transcription factor n=1 Tax=Kibdelosporangium philippinense TaxID=211113 RepID=A0ABS8ZI03_9PSEU|nr:response regulator transcription factor [Kibdelosporangium philippinense]MCE7007444.1 response regulator transcription factor [Kibdelosporangium philippinense]